MNVKFRGYNKVARVLYRLWSYILSYDFYDTTRFSIDLRYKSQVLLNDLLFYDMVVFTGMQMSR